MWLNMDSRNTTRTIHHQLHKMERYKFVVRFHFQNMVYHLALEQVHHIVDIVDESILNLNVLVCKNANIATMHSIRSNHRQSEIDFPNED